MALYKGNLYAENLIASQTPKSDNCAVSIRNLPADCTLRDLLGKISGVGKIYASNIMAPTEAHQNAAAKIAFWDRDTLHKFFTFVAQGRFVFGDHVPLVVMNLHPSPSQPASWYSRVLEIGGPADLISVELMQEFFKKCGFKFETEKITEVWRNRFTAHVQFHFAAYRYQASNAVIFLDRAINGKLDDTFNLCPKQREKFQQIFWYFMPDPCDR
ncbi:hypothetical protein F4778DRAFT_783776 [Xylariomycetidae sp. FL2044]|nr:hypothetical protein F4778DRAFT_783776 [Xylariomycetidae sp. FL2044]